MNNLNKAITAKASREFAVSMNRAAYNPTAAFDSFGFFHQGRKTAKTFWMSSGFVNYKGDEIELARIVKGTKLPSRRGVGIALQQFTAHGLSEFVRRHGIYARVYVVQGKAVTVKELLSDILQFAHSNRENLVIAAGFGMSRESQVDELVIELYSSDRVLPEDRHCARFVFSDLELLSPRSALHRTSPFPFSD